MQFESEILFFVGGALFQSQTVGIFPSVLSLIPQSSLCCTMTDPGSVYFLLVIASRPDAEGPADPCDITEPTCLQPRCSPFPSIQL